MLFRKDRNSGAFKWELIGSGGKLFIDLLFCGSKIQVNGLTPAVQSLLLKRRCIFAFWHSRILLPSYVHKGMGACIMVSNSADGEIIARIIERQGHSAVRGSTGKGGQRALVQLIHAVKNENRPGAVVPDGPQGPRHIVQPGIVLLAQKTGLPILPITYSARRRKTFASWDRFILPFPGTSCVLFYGKPIHVPPDGGPGQIGNSSLVLQHELNRITAEAEKQFGRTFEP